MLGTLAWAGPLRLPLLPADLVAQNIDVVLNRRSCMAATLRIIEENIPEVRPLSHEVGGTRVGYIGWGREAGVFLIPWPVVLPLNSPLPQLLSLNLSNNKLYRLDDLSSIVQKAPNLKILNLSGNEVSLRAQLCLDRVDRGGESLPRGSKRQGGHLRDGGEGGGWWWLRIPNLLVCF